MALKPTDRIWRGDKGGQERSFRGVAVSITAKDSSLLSNKHESWSISQLKRQQTVMETQQRMGRQRYLTWERLSCSQGRSRASSRRKSQRATRLSAKSILYHTAECHVLCVEEKKGTRIPRFWVYEVLAVLPLTDMWSSNKGSPQSSSIMSQTPTTWTSTPTAHL